MSGLDALLSELNSVIMTKTTKGGSTEQEIMKEYTSLCGKRVEFAVHGYRSLGDLLRAHPEKFSCVGNRWFGKITEENEDIVRSMASEKSKRGLPRGRFAGPGFHPSSRGPTVPPHVFFPRSNSLGRNEQQRFHQSASDGFLQNPGRPESSNAKNTPGGPPLLAGGNGWKATQRVPAKIGFGNKSYNYVPSEAGSTKSSSDSASVDACREEDFDAMPPPGLDDVGRSSVGSEKQSEHHRESFRGMVANVVEAVPEYPPGLGFAATEDELPDFSRSNLQRQESFRAMVACDVEAPDYPPGLPIDDPKDDSLSPHSHPDSLAEVKDDSKAYPPGLSAQGAQGEPTPSLLPDTISVGGRELTEEQLSKLDIAQKTYDLLKQANAGMSVKEIASRIQLPKSRFDVNTRAQIGVALIAHLETFSLSSMDSDGIVRIIRGAPRPNTRTYPIREMPSQTNERASSACSSRDMGRDDDIIYKPPRREKKERNDINERHNHGLSDGGKPQWIHDDSGISRNSGLPDVDSRKFGNSRFSVPTPSNEYRRQPPDVYENSIGKDKFTRTSTPPITNFQPPPNYFYNGREDISNRDYGRGDEMGRNRREHNDERENRPPYEECKRRSPNNDGNCELPRATPSAGRFAQYHEEITDRHRHRRISVNLEPKKFECKHKYLMNSTAVPRFESVILTHFVALDEFYVRSCRDEKQYQNMLVQLRDDYKGTLEDALPQFWMRGDGAAVRYERRWQRAVVRTPVNDTTSITNVEVFLVDVGKTVTVSSEQMVPLHEYYHTSPFALCCTIGYFDIIAGHRKNLLDQCNTMANCFAKAVDDDLEIESIERFYDETEKLKVRVIYHSEDSDGRRTDVMIPRYFVDEGLITLR
ncbi:hypothetical protein RB195_007773 [Necator americanus]|uniref:Tudor domain-containing protein n=1 Tax=Necator americanus TaxID=51031 RepID=A0ABR1C0G0_NECAM